MRQPGSASAACTVARGGAEPGSTQVSQTAFIGRLRTDVSGVAVGHHAGQVHHPVEDGGLAVAGRDMQAAQLAHFLDPSFDSLPASRRLMFSRWRQARNMAITKRASVIDLSAYQATRSPKR